MARRDRKRREKAVLTCRHCGRVFEGRVDALYCGPKCRAAAWQRSRHEKALTHVARVEEALRALRRVLGQG